MIEIPESLHLAQQLNQTLKGRTITKVTPWQSPHKLAFLYGDPATYGKLFTGKTFKKADGFGSWVELMFEDVIFAISEDTGFFFTKDEKKLPQKHQMLFCFDDGSFLCAKVKMYGALVGASIGSYDNKYYLVAKEKPALFTDDFSLTYFNDLLSNEKVEKLSIKACLATEQRIPGLGNGVLQDILFNGKLHPKRKVRDIPGQKRNALYHTIISTVKEMTEKGGRDTEKNLFGNPGGYQTKMSKFTVKKPCQQCNSIVEKASYMGGSVYFCPTCQPLH